MSLLWRTAMAWHDDDRENEPDQWEDFRDARPYSQRRDGLVDQIADAHDVPRENADRALEKIENHSQSIMADSKHFGFSDYVSDARSHAGNAEMRTPELWHRAHVAQVPLKGMKASQSWVRPSGVAHNLFHPGTRAPEEEGVEGDPDYNPEWDEDRHRETDEMMSHEYGGKPQPKTDLPRFLKHTDGSYTCLDGHHRVSADLLLGKESIPGRVIHEKQLTKAANAAVDSDSDQRIRLYRGEGTHEKSSYYPPQSGMAGGWWTTDLDSATRYSKSSPDGKVYSLDVHPSEAEPHGLPGYFFVKDPEVRKRRVEHTAATNTAVDADGNPVDSEVHYIDHHALSKMYSGDYDVPMTHAMREMQTDWDETGGFPGDPEYAHHRQVEHGGPRPYVDHLKRQISAEGIQEPLTIRGGNVVIDGHHRGVAAMEMRLPKIPVRYTR